MSKKTLLKEATVRRFMKLATLDRLSDNFINERGMTAYQDDEDPMGDEEEGAMPPSPEVDMPEEEPEAPEDMGPEIDAEAADEVEITEEDRAALAAAIPVLDKIAGEGGEEMPEMPEMPEEEPEMPEGEPEAPEMGPPEEEEEAIMQEVARRVAHRLRNENLTTKGGNKYKVWSKKGPNTAKFTAAGDAGLASKGGYSGKMFESEDPLGEDVDEVLDEVDLIDEDDLVQEVTRRVANRLRSLVKGRKK